MISDSQIEIFLYYYGLKTGRSIWYLHAKEFYDDRYLIFYCYSDMAKDILKSDSIINMDSNLKQLVDKSICGLTYDYVEARIHDIVACCRKKKLEEIYGNTQGCD